MSNWDYAREERPRIEEGNYRFEVVSATEKTSRAGNPMIEIEIRPNPSNIKIKCWFVKNEYFNRNMTEFFDATDIPEGNFNLVEWVGATGAVNLKTDEDGYLKVKYFIRKDKAESLPKWVGEKPKRNVVNNDFMPMSAADDDFPAEMPWEN